MPAPAHLSRPRRASRLELIAFSLIAALLVAACGGSATPGPSGSGPAASGTTAQPTLKPTDPGPDIGEPIAAAVIEGALPGLEELESYVYDETVVGAGSDGPETTTANGIVRHQPDEARSVTYDGPGGPTAYIWAEDQDWADFGAGFQRLDVPVPASRAETDPLAIGIFWPATFAGYAGDFIVAGRETLHGRTTIHLVLDEDTLAEVRASRGDGAGGWIAELWLLQSGYRLVKAVWGGPDAPAPAPFGQPNWTFEVTDLDCECPVLPPG